jgi:hypothetical protein
MFSPRLRAKLLLLLLLSVLTVGAHFSGTATASCGKCAAAYDSNWNVIGHACIQTGSYNCVATVSGCDFPGRCDGGGGGIGPDEPENP